MYVRPADQEETENLQSNVVFLVNTSHEFHANERYISCHTRSAAWLRTPIHRTRAERTSSGVGTQVVPSLQRGESAICLDTAELVGVDSLRLLDFFVNKNQQASVMSSPCCCRVCSTTYHRNLTETPAKYTPDRYIPHIRLSGTGFEALAAKSRRWNAGPGSAARRDLD